MSTPRTSSSHTSRPQSSLSQRPLSRISSRPLSRISGRTLVSRHAAKLAQLSHVMVSQVTKGTLEGDPDFFSEVYGKALRTLESRQVSSETLETVDARVQRLAKKARIGIQENLAEALLKTWTGLKTVASDDFQDDDEIKLSNLPELMQFLVRYMVTLTPVIDAFQLELAAPALPSTLAHADIVLSGEIELSTKPTKLTWRQIMEEEPFEGEHWEGVFSGNPRDGDSGPSSASERESEIENELSFSGESEVSTRSYSSRPGALDQLLMDAVSSQSDCFRGSSLESRQLMERLREKQTWRQEWEMDVKWARPFNIADPSTLAAAVSRIMEPRIGGKVHTPKAFNEVDAVRDVLLLLQGIDSPLTQFLVDDFGERTQASISTEAPRLMHLSFDAYRSILTEFCFSATRLQEMRYFIKSVYTLRENQNRKRTTSVSSERTPIFISRTLEAFAEAVDAYTRDIDKWCGSREEAIVQARGGTGRQMVTTLLSCCHEMKEQITSTLEITQDILRQLVKRELRKDGSTHHRGDVEKLGFLRAKDFSSIPPFVLSTRILDLLLQGITTQLAIGELSTASRLTTIFVTSAEPVWKRMGQWVRDGMKVGTSLDMDEDDGVEKDMELFIRRQGIDFTNPDFWERGYVLRCEGDGSWDESHIDVIDGPLLVPDVFVDVANEILAAGKVVGLLRAIGIEPFVEAESQWTALKWGTFADIYSGSTIGASDTKSPSLEDEPTNPVEYDATYTSRLAMGSLSLILNEHVSPWCKSANAKLNKLLLEDCNMMEHLSAIENFYFMRQGDAMVAFCDQLFSKLDAQERWHDIHFLNRTLRDVSNRDRKPWIAPELMQFHVRGGRERNNALSVRCFDGLVADYTVSFPLTYLFRRPSAVVYTTVFILLVQVRRAKSVVDHIQLQEALRAAATLGDGDLNRFFSLKAKFSWFINVLMNFLTTHVIHVRSVEFRALFTRASTLDGMIATHDHYLALLQTLCFLQSKTAAVHRSLLSILDLALQFASAFAHYMGESTRIDKSFSFEASSTQSRRHRRHQKRTRRTQRNTIGFVDNIAPSDAESSSPSSEGEMNVQRDEEVLADMASERMARPSLVSSMSFAEESFTVKVDRLSDELDALVKYVRMAVDVLAGGSSETSSTFGVLSFMLEEWDI